MWFLFTSSLAGQIQFHSSGKHNTGLNNSFTGIAYFLWTKILETRGQGYSSRFRRNPSDLIRFYPLTPKTMKNI